MERTCGIRIGAGRVAGVSTRKNKMMDADVFIIFFFSKPLQLAIRRMVKAIDAANAGPSAIYAADASSLLRWWWRRRVV